MARARTLVLDTKVNVTGADKLTGLGAKFKETFSKKNLAVAGVAGAMAAGAAAIAGLADAARALIDIERLNAQTAAAIKSTGGAANVTSKQVEDMSESMESLTTIEREAVQEGANMLLTFTNVRNEIGAGNDIFNQATEAALDMSVALGTDLTSANMLLGKALNDPVKGMTAMTRAGIQFTAQQKEMIEAMVRSGDLLGAQKIILGELETQFGGSAAAFADTTAGRVQRFQNDVGNMFESIVVGATKVADFIGDVDLFPFDDEAERIKLANDNLNAETERRIADLTAYAPQMEAAAETALSDPIVEALLGGKEEAARIAGETPGAISQALLDKQFSVEDAAASLGQAIEDGLLPSVEAVGIIGFLTSRELADGLASNVPAVRVRAQELKEAAESRLRELSGAAFNYGYNFGASYAAGIVNSLGLVHDAGRQLGGALASQVRIESEPPDHSSPLYGITKWGANIVRTLRGGVLHELGSLRSASGALAGAMVPGFGGALTPTPASVGGGGITINLHVNGDLKAEERTLPGTILRGLNAAGVT